MKSSSYYTRKASACVELGRWCAAKDWQAMAKKARRIEKAKASPFVTIHTLDIARRQLI